MGLYLPDPGGGNLLVGGRAVLARGLLICWIPGPIGIRTAIGPRPGNDGNEPGVITGPGLVGDGGGRGLDKGTYTG